MPRYAVERTFPQGLNIPISDNATKAVQTGDANSAQAMSVRRDRAPRRDP